MAWALLFFKGLVIGVANIIPGVSGGTFALLLGIYERLIRSVKSVGVGTLRHAAGLLSFRAGAPQRFREEWRRIDGAFLLTLVTGAVVAILACSRLIKFLLAEYPELTLAFFVGLILPSMAAPYAMMTRRRPIELLWALAGAAVVVAIALAGAGAGAKGGETGGAGWLAMLACGALAISAMILPGVSGSFLLLVLGQYTAVIDAINAVTGWGRALVTGGDSAFPLNELGLLGCFAAGALAGLAGFTRLLAWLLKRYHSQTMAFLIGLIAGSLWTLWPFKDYSAAEKITACPNVIPGVNAVLAWALLAAAAGFALAVGSMFLGRRVPAEGARPEADCRKS